MKGLNQKDKAIINLVKSLVGDVKIVKSKANYQIVFNSGRDNDYIAAVERAVRGRAGETKFLSFESEKCRYVITLEYGE